MLLKRSLFLMVYLAFPCFTFAQTEGAKDTTKIYRDIEQYSKKRKSTNFIYNLFFRPVKDSTATSSKSSSKKRKLKTTSLKTFEGKIIREIFVTTLDPFGTSVTDTATSQQSFLSNLGNNTHFKSQQFAIRNLLLVHKNDPFDSLLVKESERLIRSQEYVHDVAFRYVLVSANSDSVDIYIRESDTWSIIPGLAISSEKFKIDLLDKNFLGLGHQFSVSVAKNNSPNVNSLSTNYFIPNFRNTYIQSGLHYEIDSKLNYNRSISVDRPFFSPFARWAAGIFVLKQFNYNFIQVNDSVTTENPIGSTTNDYWFGYSKQIFKGNTEEDRTTNLIIAARYYNIHYQEKPTLQNDSLHQYSDEHFPLFSIGISKQKFVQDQFVFKYGLTEDIPIGQVVSLSFGYQYKTDIVRTYIGAHISSGKYTPMGYLSYYFEYGTFIHSSRLEQGVISAGVNYFTDLFEIGKWKFRQFIDPRFTLGLNRFQYESITINNENGIRGFDAQNLNGTKKIVATFQTQSYAPWSFLGFRFGPYLIFSIGVLGTNERGFKRSRLYQQYSFGILFKNEYLVFNYFQLSFSFYPLIPGSGENIIKLNSNNTTDLGFTNFTLGKPAIVTYQ